MIRKLKGGRLARRPLALAAGLAATALMLGCDGAPTDTALDAPGPSLHHRDGHAGGGGGGGGGGDDGGSGGSTNYTYTHSGDLTTDPGTADAIKNVGKGKESNDVVMSGAGDDDQLILSGAFLSAIDPDASCFPPNHDSDGIDGNDAFRTSFAGAIEPTGATTTESSYFFSAFADDGASPIDYQLVVRGTHDGDPAFPPAPGKTVTITFGDADMNTKGKSKGACTGSGLSVDGTVEVTGVS